MWTLRQCIKNSKWYIISSSWLTGRIWYELNVQKHVMSIHISMCVGSKPVTYLFSCIDTSFMTKIYVSSFCITTRVETKYVSKRVAKKKPCSLSVTKQEYIYPKIKINFFYFLSTTNDTRSRNHFFTDIYHHIFGSHSHILTILSCGLEIIETFMETWIITIDLTWYKVTYNTRAIWDFFTPTVSKALSTVSWCLRFTLMYK